MTDQAVAGPDAAARRRTTRELVAYFALTFAITFGLGGAFIFFRPQFEALFGTIRSPDTSWFYFVAVCAPTISAVLVSAVFGGWKGVRDLFSGLIRPFRLRWAFAGLLSFPAGLLIWGLVERYVFGHAASPSVDIHAILISAPLLLFTTGNIFLDPGPWGEETGWRGFALPRLLARFSPLTAALLLGAIWGVWHTSAFFVSGLVQSGYNYALFVAASVLDTVLMTWIYVNANRNYLVAGFFVHLMNNTMVGAHAFTDIRVQALVLLVIAVAIVAAFGPSLRGWRFVPATPKPD
ncbi:MAG TPA: CPBP family intramembrane glutamic endopeptidase [Rhizomicrobium sp.]|jgi:membrane protease YdiL (CAAX protease family)|nr:CPBP family intramembrane glutamic endopeptidase [Rhizomicrobium sp.]